MRNALFTQVAMKSPTQSTFDLTHDVKMSGKMGQLMPCMCLDVLPGDNIQLGADALIRLAPILAPIMHRVDFTVHYFFVPNRLLWPNWEDFITGTNKTDGNPYIPPYIDYTDGLSDSMLKLGDYLGVPPPPPSSDGERVSALPFAAYNLIYNEYYRDQNLIDPIPEDQTIELADGDVTADMIVDTQLRYRAWEHDYFTACLPFAQKGSAVDIPLGVVELRESWDEDGVPYPIFEGYAGTSPAGNINNDTLGGEPSLRIGGTINPAAYNPNGSLTVGATTINDLRRAYRLQEWLEKNARGGTRYTEAIRAHFDVKSPDSRLQRPEYITGIKAPVIVTEVLNTQGPTDFYNGSAVEQTGSPQGAMTGHAAGMHQGSVGRYYAQEHGWVIGIISVMPKTAYQQGIHKMFSRSDFMDFAFPTFANLGEQEVLTREVYAYDATTSSDLFGYIPRYAEYKFMNSRVAGDFRTTLDFWHLGRIFGAAPTLSQSFIECVPEDVLRIFAVQDDTDNLWMHILNKAKFKRKLPFFGTPTI